jgi:CYTH domain-containing protein
MKLCALNKVEKTRFIIPEASGLVFEVDVFRGQNKGLIIAEIELPSHNSTFVKPDWLGEEVTGDAKYYNAILILKPFSSWEK